MDKVRVYYDRTGNTLSVWFDDPKKEHVCQEIDEDMVLMATAAAHAVEYVGLPECQLNLAEAAIYLARAPKSNSVIRAIGQARQDAASADPVPLHLREPGHPGLRKHGYGAGYKYPHDYPGHRVEQEYRPAAFQGRRYYEPSDQGEEGEPWPAPPEGGAVSDRDPSPHEGD